MSRHADIGSIASGVSDDPTTSNGVDIEPLQGVAHAREVEQLQMEIWNGNEAWIVPSHVLLIVSEYGGVLLGARIDGELVGFVLGFLAGGRRHLFHASHMLGVLPASRHHGVGAALKWRQRDAALTQHLDLMRWTFDPLEARNAHFNFHKLGAVCSVYRSDYYGPMQDALNRDLPSDRLLIQWHLHHVEHTPMPATPPHTLLRNRDGVPEHEIDLMEVDQPLAIEIPRDLQSMKRDAPDLALSWRIAVREAFSKAFARGYVACDFRDGAYMLLPEKWVKHET